MLNIFFVFELTHIHVYLHVCTCINVCISMCVCLECISPI